MANKKEHLSISVVTPSYNQGKFITETIESVIQENYPHLDYLIMDGGSTDNTVKILKSYGKKIRWISKKDKGQSDAINKGLKQTKGEIVCYLNSDDCFVPGALDKVNHFFQSHPNAMWVTGDYLIVNEQSQEIRSFIRHYKNWLRASKSKNVLLVTNYIVQPSTFFRRELLDKIGYFNVNLRYNMDYDYWLRVWAKYPLYILNTPLSRFRIHGESINGSQYQRMFDTEIELLRQYTQDYWLISMHRLHNALVKKIYKLLLAFHA